MSDEIPTDYEYIVQLLPADIIFKCDDAVKEKIVRCRDCSHQHYNPLCGYICDNFGFVIPDDNLDGFCAWGERYADKADC